MAKKICKKLIICFTVVLLVFNSTFVGIYASEDNTINGVYNNIKWEINTTTGLMTVEGTGCFGEWIYIDGMFYNHYRSYVKELIVGNGITEIGCVAFDSCTNLTKVTLPNSVSVISQEAFWGCSSLEEVEFGSGIKQIGPDAFWGTALTEVNIPGNLTSIKDAFANIKTLKSVTIGGDNLEMFASFSGCTALSEVIINGTVLSIGAQTFKNCSSLESLKISGDVETIGENAFYGCSKLKSINLSHEVTRIGDNAFYGCTSFTDVYFGGTEEEWNLITIGTNNTFLTDATIHFNHTHSYMSSGTEPTAESGGELTFTCVCGDYYTKTIPALGFAPKGGMAVDYGSNTIYGLPAGTRSLDAFTTFTDSSYIWAYANIGAGFGTGTVAFLLDETSIIGKYTILIYGDIDGNGWYDANDAFIVNMIVQGFILPENLSNVQRKAADCNHDGVIDGLDFNLLMSASLLTDKINQSADSVELETNTAFIEYASIIDQSAELEWIKPEVEPEEEQPSNPITAQPEQDIRIELILTNVFEFIKEIFDLVISILF